MPLPATPSLSDAFRIRHKALSAGLTSTNGADNDYSAGLEPGDITKYMAQPWQADFNECAAQDIDITYKQWCDIYPASTGDPVKPITQKTFWWPSHRPMQVFGAQGQTPWSGQIPQTSQGDLMMVTAWNALGFIKDNPDYTPQNGQPQYILVESNS